MTKHECERINRIESAFLAMAPRATAEDFTTLRRASMTLRRWFARECGTVLGCVKRDETTGRCYWVSCTTGNQFAVRDRETGARRRIASICDRLGLSYYIQTDPRGCALYVSDQTITDSDYDRGVAIG